jgi:hypothetical protein
MTDFWIRNTAGQKAVIAAADRDRWTVQGWSPALAPADGEMVWMEHPDDGVTQPGLIPWAARDYFLGIGWKPCAPPAPVDLTRDPVLTDGDAAVPTGAVAEVTEWVGNDRQRAEQALAAELGRDKPRTTLVDSLNRVGQPETDAAAAASHQEA